MQFFEKKRRKGGGLGWFTSGTKVEEEVCWEMWCLEITLATPRTEAGRLVDIIVLMSRHDVLTSVPRANKGHESNGNDFTEDHDEDCDRSQSA